MGKGHPLNHPHTQSDICELIMVFVITNATIFVVAAVVVVLRPLSRDAVTAVLPTVGLGPHCPSLHQTIFHMDTASQSGLPELASQVLLLL